MELLAAGRDRGRDLANKSRSEFLTVSFVTGSERGLPRPQPAARNADSAPPSTLLWKLLAADFARGPALAQLA